MENDGIGELVVLNRDSLGSRAYQSIRRGLMTGAFKPGQELLLRNLASELGISITPVREALLRLVSEKALIANGSRSIRVPVLTPERFLEIRDLRVELEGKAAEAATLKMSERTIKQLEETQNEYDAARTRADVKGALTINERFHFMLYEAAQMPVLYGIIESLWVQAGPVITRLHDEPWRPLTERHEHQDVLQGLRARDPRYVRQALASDIVRASAILLQRLDAGDNDLASLSAS
jgi:GntR family colanic acid and biofilm gene transcriptional regulator